jgi:hypothetical protein
VLVGFRKVSHDYYKTLTLNVSWVE